MCGGCLKLRRMQLNILPSPSINHTLEAKIPYAQYRVCECDNKMEKHVSTQK